MNHTGVREVRKYNPDNFVKDFRRLHSFIVITSSGEVYEVRKMDVWAAAKRGLVRYYLTDKIYVHRRTSMVLI